MKTIPLSERPGQEAPPVPRLAFSVEEAAASACLSKAKLYELMKAGELRYRKCGARRLITVVDLEAFLARLPQGPQGGRCA